MKVTIIGPGIMAIPPLGWGAVEILIWDYAKELEKVGVEVQIVNTRNFAEIVEQTNNFNPDFVHLQYDDYYSVLQYINCPKIAVTSHYGYIVQHQNNFGGYQGVFNSFMNGKHHIFALSSQIRDVYVNKGFDPNKIKVTPNGANKDLFRYSETCVLPNKSIYLAKIDYRKRQSIFQNISSLDFAGNIADGNFNTNRPNYLGEWSKEYLYDNLTNYANLVLLSDGEAHALVCCEAMMAGLGLVISEAATANLDTSLPFIDVIPESRIRDIDYVESVIILNREKSLLHRSEIREYALNNFSWSSLIPKYIETINNL